MFSAALALVLAVPALAEPLLAGRAACNRDNCLRQVVASAFSSGPARGSADCKAFQTTTFTPCPTTTTMTASAVVSTSVTLTTTVSSITVLSTSLTTTTAVVTSVVPARRRMLLKRASSDLSPAPGFELLANGKIAKIAPAALLKPRVVAPSCSGGILVSSTSVPSYASGCDSPARYASACSCNGVTAVTVTAARPTSTATVTPTTTTVRTEIVSQSTGTTVLAGTSTIVVMTTTTTTAAAPSCTRTSNDQFPGVQEQCGDGSICNSPPRCAFGTSMNDCDDACFNDPNCVALYEAPQNGQCLYFVECCTS